MRVHPDTALIPTTTTLSLSPTPSISTTMLCPEKNMREKTREMVGRLVHLQHMGKTSYSPLGASNRDGNLTNRVDHGRFSLYLPHPNPRILPPPSNRLAYCSSGVVIRPPSPFNTQLVRVPTTPTHIFFPCKKIPANRGARGGTHRKSFAGRKS